MEQEKIVSSEIRTQIKEEKANRQTVITSFSSTLVNDQGGCGSQMDFDTVGASEVWGFDPSYTRSDDRCRECKWFDPACDLCYFFGAARIDDLACESFHHAE